MLTIAVGSLFNLIAALRWLVMTNDGWDPAICAIRSSPFVVASSAACTIAAVLLVLSTSIIIAPLLRSPIARSTDVWAGDESVGTMLIALLE